MLSELLCRSRRVIRTLMYVSAIVTSAHAEALFFDASSAVDTNGGVGNVRADMSPPMHERPAPCGWIAGPPSAHRAWPRQILPAPASTACTAKADAILVRLSHPLLLTSESQGATTVLRVVALEDGWAGEVIRCRSSLNGAVLLGRVVNGDTVELVQPDRKTGW